MLFRSRASCYCDSGQTFFYAHAGVLLPASFCSMFLLCLAPCIVLGDLLALESFDVFRLPSSANYASGPLHGQQKPVLPGWGKGSPWEGVQSGLSKVERVPLRSKHYGYPFQGGRCWVRPSKSKRKQTEMLQRPLDKPFLSGSYYLSVLIHPGWEYVHRDESENYAVVGFTSPFDRNAISALNDAAFCGVFVGFQVRAQEDRIDVILRAPDESGKPKNHVIAKDVEPRTYLVVARIEPQNNSHTEHVTYWVNPSHLGSEESLRQTAEWMGSIETDCLRQDTPIDRISIVRFNYGRDFLLDEVRLATRIQDLTTPSGRSMKWLYIFWSAVAVSSCLVYYKTKIPGSSNRQ